MRPWQKWKREWFSVARTNVPELGPTASDWPDLGRVLFLEIMVALGRSVVTPFWAELGGHQFPQGEMKVQTSFSRRNAHGGGAKAFSKFSRERVNKWMNELFLFSNIV